MVVYTLCPFKSRFFYLEQAICVSKSTVNDIACYENAIAPFTDCAALDKKSNLY